MFLAHGKFSLCVLHERGDIALEPLVLCQLLAGEEGQVSERTLRGC